MVETVTPTSRLRIDDRLLRLDGEPVRLFSGAMHYFRTMPEQWPDRLAKLKAMGLNTIETYVAWNLHQPTSETFNYDGLANLPAFIEAVADQGMHMIVRPGPYICAEWDFGGLPAWLLADDELHLRAAEPRYLAAVDRFFEDLFPRILPYTAERGGHIIAMQIENEYGSYGRDKAYLSHLGRRMRELGYEGLLFTSDGPTDTMLTNGTLRDIWKTANFGSRAAEAFTDLDRYEQGPRMVMEFWNGWFDHWGETHHTRAAEDAADALDEILANDGHVNFYMAHGGTNFGFWNGANTDPDDRYQPTVSSYDYDCALTEAGEITPKYGAFQAILAKYGAQTCEPPASRAPLVQTICRYRGAASLVDNLGALSRSIQSAAPIAMEKLNQSFGYALYRTHVETPSGILERPLHAIVRDRAHVFVDGRQVAVISRNDDKPANIVLPEGRCQLDILVENQGRVNYGRHLRDPKGLLGGVWLDYTEVTDWEIFPLPLSSIDLEFDPAIAPDQPAFHKFEFEVAVPGDAFVELPGWTKGVVFLNGFNLGRYWNIGPQLRLYAPWPLMRVGTNSIVVFETDGAGKDCILT